MALACLGSRLLDGVRVWTRRGACRMAWVGLWGLVAVLSTLDTANAQKQQEKAQSIATRTEVADGQWQAIRLRNLPQGAKLRIVLETDGELEIFVVSAEEYERLPDPGTPLLAASTGGRLDVSLRVPASSDYYLVLDNRRGEESRQVSVGITGSR